MAKPIMVAIIEDPPYDIIGSGDPTIGTMPKTIAMFITIYIKIEVPKP